MPRATLECIEFVVDETPRACWEWDLRQRNLAFLQGLSPEYFDYVARTSFPQLDTEDKHHAALAIRTAYSQALETLFALLCAAAQAPDCTLGWMLAYQPFQLRNVVERIAEGLPILHRLPKSPTWTYLAELTHGGADAPPDRLTWLIDNTARAWQRFASEFLHEVTSAEYNSAKHGLRTHLGGFTMRYGKGRPQGQPIDLESMTPIVTSEFGTRFFTLTRLGDKTNFRPLDTAHNWDPEQLANRLVFLSWSITNVILALRRHNGDAAEGCQFVVPNEQEVFDKLWKRRLGSTWINVGIELTPEHIRARSDDDILRSYERTST